jgi:hypothetical protein
MTDAELAKVRGITGSGFQSDSGVLRLGIR